MSDFDEQIAAAPNLDLAKRMKRVAWVLTTIVLLVVGSMRQITIPLPDGVSLSFLPAVHALINSVVAALLVLAVVLIKQKNVIGHRRAMTVAMSGSVLFLVGYVAYHTTTEHTSFGGTGPIRFIYFALLVTHILFAAVSLPFILYTWIYGITNQFVKHRQLARWVFPMWLYVAVSGPICYFMLRPYYP